MIHVLIVEDDPMVAQIDRQYLRDAGSFHIAPIARNGEEALGYLRKNPVDLVILDVYMPGTNGIEVLRKIREEHMHTSVIMVTAATEMGTVEEALQLGAVDYLIKPFSAQRFKDAVHKFLVKENLARNNEVADQNIADQLFHTGVEQSKWQQELCKGLNQKTLACIYNYMQQHAGEQYTCESLSAVCGLSKVTVRRYLNYLIENGQADSTVDYETGGRPRLVYMLR